MIPEITKGDRLRKAREAKGLNQFELADHIGIGRATVQNYETGKTDPRPLIVKQWALVTGVPVYWLQWGMEEAPTGPMPDRGFGELVFTSARPEGFEPPTFWLGANGSRKPTRSGRRTVRDVSSLEARRDAKVRAASTVQRVRHLRDAA